MASSGRLPSSRGTHRSRWQWRASSRSLLVRPVHEAEIGRRTESARLGGRPRLFPTRQWGARCPGRRPRTGPRDIDPVTAKIARLALADEVADEDDIERLLAGWPEGVRGSWPGWRPLVIILHVRFGEGGDS